MKNSLTRPGEFASPLKPLFIHLPGRRADSYLRLVTAGEVAQLREAIARGMPPIDLELKLDKLSQGSLTERFVEQQSRLMIELLRAAGENSFRQASSGEVERLLRVLAYVRKDDDAIADYRRDGFLDDQQEIRLALNELAPLFKSFKDWRLRHQVPILWER